MRSFLSVCVLGLCLAAPAFADPNLQFAAPEAWVKPLTLPTAAVTTQTGPVQVLLENVQVNFGDDGTTTYSEVAFRINNPQGLQAAMTSLSWNPEIDTITVHKVHILRGDQVIDVLADGQTFSTMRRESNLEKSMLDGVLTAVLQPEDIQVGDILDYSLSIKRNDPVLKGMAEGATSNFFPVPVAKVAFRAEWSKSRPMTWKASPDLSAAKLTSTKDRNEVTVNIDNFTPLQGPASAPARYYNFTNIEYSQFATWADAAALMAPLYAKAETLKDGSKLKAEADKIKAASSDPNQQAADALHLVQNKVRYVFLGMNEGGYVPADADLTWSRRFGDCKGKTVVLLALLHALGIKAEPALISTEQGDGLDARLPTLERFDHVIVRAEIAGKVYWLDGTRYGDRGLDSLAIPDYHWALPVRDAGAVLVALKPAPLDQAASEAFLKIDSTAGLDVPAPAHAEEIFRGDVAVELNAKLAAEQPTDLDKQLRDYWKERHDFIDIDSVTWSFDAASGELRFIMDGKAKMDWDTLASSRSRQYEADGAHLGWTSDLKRDATVKADVPVLVDYPGYVKAREVILLPDQGKGFTIKGDLVDQTLAGFAFKRKLEIKDGVFLMEASARAVVPEISYKEAMDAIEPLKALWKGQVFVKAPVDYQATVKDVQAASADTPKTAEGFLKRGSDFLSRNKYDLARADFDAVLKLDPQNARAMAGRAYTKFYKGDKDGAKADIDAAALSNPQEGMIYDARAMMAADAHDYNGALVAYTHALQLDASDLYALEGRAGAYMALGDRVNAMKDIDAKLKSQPDSISALRTKAQIFNMDMKHDEAIATLHQAIAVDPDDDSLHLWLGSMLAACMGQDHKNCSGQRTEARAEFTLAIAKRPTAEAYAYRAQTYDRYDKDARAAQTSDLDAAFKLDPNSSMAHMARGFVSLADKDYDKAIADFTAIIDNDPKGVRGHVYRAEAYEAKGDPDHEIIDWQVVIGSDPDNATWHNNLCWAYATHNRELTKAMDECNTAIKLSPVSNFYDSRALVYLLLGRNDEAIADYNAILVSRPDLPSALYPRGVAELRKGLTKAGKADIDRATLLNSHVADMYAGYGIKP